MASIANDPGGRRRILFVDPNGDRKAVRLGKVSQRAAEGFKCRVEGLLECQLLKRPMESDLANWVSDLDASIAKRLAAVGLIAAPEEKAAVLLGPFLRGYITGRSDLKASTIAHLEDAERDLKEYFGADRPLDQITPGDADDFRLHLGKRLGDNTVRRKCGRAKQFFRAACRKRLIRENPFDEMKGLNVRENRERDFFVTREMTQAVLDACPNAEWRLLFALSRFGGLRCPSEHLALRLNDVDWARNRMIVRSPKTEHHEGKGSRIVPVFPELRPYLDAVFHAAPNGAEYFINRYRDPNCNLRTQLERIIAKAGLEPWPKLFANLRASRATELAAEFPAHVAASWLGHSTVVASKHYWQVTDGDFEKATGYVAVSPEEKTGGAKSGAESGARAAQNRAQRVRAGDGGESHNEGPDAKKPRKNQGQLLIFAPGDESAPSDAICAQAPQNQPSS